jgi:hypothetical protein
MGAGHGINLPDLRRVWERIMFLCELDRIVEQSLRSFYKDISSNWWGRENEMINLYAWCHLSKLARQGTIFSDHGQIGIEVAVRQLPPDVLRQIDSEFPDCPPRPHTHRRKT